MRSFWFFWPCGWMFYMFVSVIWYGNLDWVASSLRIMQEIQVCNILWYVSIKITCLPSQLDNKAHVCPSACAKRGALLWHSAVCACNGPTECLSVQPSCVKVDNLEGVASANVLQFLGDLGRCSIQLLCHTFLLVRIHAVKLLTQISIYHILERKTKRWGLIRRSPGCEDLKRRVRRRWKYMSKQDEKIKTLTGK